jgi:hypothetical protein
MTKKEQELTEELRQTKEMLKLERRLHVRSDYRLGIAERRIRDLTATVVEMSVERISRDTARREQAERDVEREVTGG